MNDKNLSNLIKELVEFDKFIFQKYTKKGVVYYKLRYNQIKEFLLKL